MNINRAAMSAMSKNPEAMMQLILSVFKSIAVVFQPEQYSSSLEVLQTKAVEIAGRMENEGLLQSLVVP